MITLYYITLELRIVVKVGRNAAKLSSWPPRKRLRPFCSLSIILVPRSQHHLPTAGRFPAYHCSLASSHTPPGSHRAFQNDVQWTVVKGKKQVKPSTCIAPCMVYKPL